MLVKFTIKAKDFICIYFRCRSAQNTYTLSRSSLWALESPAGQGRWRSLEHLQMDTQTKGMLPLSDTGLFINSNGEHEKAEALPKSSSFKQSGVWLSIKQFEEGWLFICFGGCQFPFFASSR